MQTIHLFILPVAGSLLAGGVIGFEREFRGRPAGLRTHILVSLASTLLMLAAVHQDLWFALDPAVVRIDPVRMAHGVLTGIGFLCGGVIFREGLSVHGLTTAASMWITAALGLLYGAGVYPLAIGGTAIAVLVLGALRMADPHLPQQHLSEMTVRFRGGQALSQAEFTRLLADHDLTATPFTQRMVDGGAIELAATIRTVSRTQTARLAERLAQHPAVAAFEIAPRND
ncbi:MAG: MgtC/SapB family protein [Caulobacteraceae bacterium]|nr:MgtC/SapB family protein [Caulobacteraceae bacterium]